jgi:uncharacterized membrane protein
MAIVGFITGTVVCAGNIEGGLLTLIYLLICGFPVVFVYRIMCATKFKKYICDIFYFVCFLLLESLAIYGSFVKNDEGVDQLCRLMAYVIFFSAIAVYFVEVIIRNQKQIKELDYKDTFVETNWKDIFGQIFKQPIPILFGTIRSYIVAVIIIFIVSTGIAFGSFEIDILVKEHILFAQLFLLCLLPAIILYHSACGLQLKCRICDMVFFTAVTIIELILLPSVSNAKIHGFVEDLNFLPFFNMSIIILGSIFVYLAEVYFRNRAILKNLEQIKNPGIPCSGPGF